MSLFIDLADQQEVYFVNKAFPNYLLTSGNTLHTSSSTSSEFPNITAQLSDLSPPGSLSLDQRFIFQKTGSSFLIKNPSKNKDGILTIVDGKYLVFE